MSTLPEDQEKNAEKKLNSYAKYSGMGIQMVVIVCLGVFGGIKLDAWLRPGSFPLFTVFLTLFSIFGALYLFLKDFIKK
jgi:ATP synthase protein I